MIPVAFESKMGVYKIPIGDTTIDLNVIDHASLLSKHLPEFQNWSLSPRRVVEIDALFDTSSSSSSSCSYEFRWLILCAGSRCLAVDFSKQGNPIPDSLKRFFADETICFAALRMDDRVLYALNRKGIVCRTGVAAWDLAVRLLRKPGLVGVKDLGKLAAEVDLEVKSSPSEGGSGMVKHHAVGFGFNDEVFSEKQMACVIHNAYYCYAIANKLLSFAS